MPVEPQTFVISPNDFDKGLLPPHARKPGTSDFAKAVNDYLKKEFEGYGGRARFIVSDKAIEVTWSPQSV
jgi:hypothetical protein